MKDFLLDDLPRKIAYSLFIIGFWVVVILGPIWIGARTVEIYNATPTSDGRIIVFAPDQEVAEIVAWVISFSILWTVGVLENLSVVLAIVAVNLLWVLLTNRDHGLGWYAGSFAISILSPMFSFALWMGAAITRKQWY